MKDSILVDDMEHCVICGSDQVQRHHVMHGTSNRKNADKDGLWIPVCDKHHRQIHMDRKMDLLWKATAQLEYEKTHSRIQWMDVYGRSYW